MLGLWGLCLRVPPFSWPLLWPPRMWRGGKQLPLSNHPAPTGIFQEAFKGECHFLNGTERVRLLVRWIYNREQYVHFDSDVGHFVGDNPIGEFQAKHFNNNEELLEQKRAEVDTVCRHNYGVFTPFTIDRKGESMAEHCPEEQAQTNRLHCWGCGVPMAVVGGDHGGGWW